MDEAEDNSCEENLPTDAVEQLPCELEPMDIASSMLHGGALPDMSPDLLRCLTDSMSMEDQLGEREEEVGKLHSDWETHPPVTHSGEGELAIQVDERDGVEEEEEVEIVKNDPMDVSESDPVQVDENGNNKTDLAVAAEKTHGEQDHGEAMVPAALSVARTSIHVPHPVESSLTEGAGVSRGLPLLRPHPQGGSERELESSEDDFLHDIDSQDEQQPSLMVIRLESPSPTPSSQSTEQSSQMHSEHPLVEDRESESIGHLARSHTQASLAEEDRGKKENSQAMNKASERDNIELGERKNGNTIAPVKACGLFTHPNVFKQVLESAASWASSKGQSSLESTVVGNKELPVAVDQGGDGNGRGGAGSELEIHQLPVATDQRGRESGRGGAESEPTTRELNIERPSNNNDEVDGGDGEMEDEADTLEVDVVGTWSESSISTLEPDMDNVPSHDAVEIIGTSSSGPIKSQLQLQSADGGPPSPEAGQGMTHQPSLETGSRKEDVGVAHSSGQGEGKPSLKRGREVPRIDNQSNANLADSNMVEKGASHEPNEDEGENILVKKSKKIRLTIDKLNKGASKKDTTGNITMETPCHSQPPFQPAKESPEHYSQEYIRSSTHAGPSTSSRSTAGPSTSGPSTAGPSNRGPLTAGPSTSGLSTSGPSTAGPSNRGPFTAGPSNRGPFTAGPSTRGSSACGPSIAGPSIVGPSTAGSSTAGPSGSSLSRILHDFRQPTPSSSISEMTDGHSRSSSPATTSSHACPRVIDPVYHDDPLLEKWRQMLDGHWFEVKLQKSLQPMTLAEKRSSKLLGFFLD